ncbi:UNVERIFIED_CONTAM: hypothetical protein FKN15_041094 [Acipenser sinensis]
MDRNAQAELLEALDSRRDAEERKREERYTALIASQKGRKTIRLHSRKGRKTYRLRGQKGRSRQTRNMDRNAQAELLEALDSRRDAEERKREERYTALIEKVGLARNGRDGCWDLEDLLGGLEDQGWCLVCGVYGHTMAICPFQGGEEEPAQERKVGRRSRKRRGRGKLQQQEEVRDDGSEDEDSSRPTPEWEEPEYGVRTG